MSVRRQKILFLEEDRAEAMTLSMALHSLSQADLHFFCTREEFLAALQRHSPELAVVDLSLEKESEQHWFRRLQQQFPRTSFVLYTEQLPKFPCRWPFIPKHRTDLRKLPAMLTNLLPGFTSPGGVSHC